MRTVFTATVLCFSLGSAAFAQDLKPAITRDTGNASVGATVDKPFFGPGVRVLRRQFAFPIVHPVKFTNNCTHPVRHPLVAFKQFSAWVAPYNSGLSACSSVASIAGSAALQTLWTHRFVSK